MKTRIIIASVFVLLLLNVSTYAQKLPHSTNPNEACQQAWKDYKKADALWKTGWGLFGAGIGLTTFGFTYGILSGFGVGAYPPDQRTPEMEARPIAGLTIGSIGSGMLVASIPCLAVGQVRRKTAKKIYDEQCGQQQPPLTFNIQSSANGLGIAMKF